MDEIKKRPKFLHLFTYFYSNDNEEGSVKVYYIFSFNYFVS